jgi:hypothetical protein
MVAHRARLTVICSDARALQLFEACGLEDVLHVVPAPDGAAVVSAPWSEEDEARAERLSAWLARYAADSA